MQKYAVIGNPVSHTWSPFIHQQFASQTQIELSYEALKLDCSLKTEFKRVLEEIFIRGYRGLNITLPYKIWAFSLIQEKNNLSARAEKSGAVNTLTFADQTLWLGDNTDGIGLVRDLKNNLGWPLKAMNILILGASGAARGAIAALIQEKPASIHVLNRDLSKAKNLTKFFSAEDVEIKLANQNHKFDYQLIINATSSSLWQQLPSTTSCFQVKNAYCYDMVYAALPTVFLNWATANQSKAASDGLGMLVEQAAESFYQWHHVRPNTHPVIQQLRHNL